MMFPSVLVFTVCGCFLFEGTLGRHLISTKWQTAQDIVENEPLGAGRVEESPESVKSFSSKQTETSNSEQGRSHDEGVVGGRSERGKDNLDFAGAEFDPREGRSGEEGDLQEVDAVNDNNDVNNVHSGSSSKYATEVSQHVEGGQQVEAKGLLGGNIDGTSGEESRGDDSPGEEKQLVEREEEAHNEGLQYDSTVKSWVNQSASNENLHGQGSSYLAGPANDSYVTHVLDQPSAANERAEDDEEGGNLSSASEVAHNVVEEGHDNADKARGSVRSRSENNSTNLPDAESTASAGSEDYEHQESNSVASERGQVDEKVIYGNVNSNKDNTNSRIAVPVNVVERPRDQARMGNENHAEMVEQESEPKDDDTKTNGVAHVTDNAEKDTEYNVPAQRAGGESERSDSSSAKISNDTVARALESSRVAKNHPELRKEDNSDLDGGGKSTDEVETSDISENEDDDQAREMENGDSSDRGMVSNSTLAKTLKSSKVNKDKANQQENKVSASDKTSQAVTPVADKESEKEDEQDPSTVPNDGESSQEEDDEVDNKEETTSGAKGIPQGDTAGTNALDSKDKVTENEEDTGVEKTEANEEGESSASLSHAQINDGGSTNDESKKGDENGTNEASDDQGPEHRAEPSGKGMGDENEPSGDEVEQKQEGMTSRRVHADQRVVVSAGVSGADHQDRVDEDDDEDNDHDGDAAVQSAKNKDPGTEDDQGAQNGEINKKEGQKTPTNEDKDSGTEDDQGDMTKGQGKDKVTNEDKDSATQDDQGDQNGEMKKDEKQQTVTNEGPVTNGAGKQDAEDSINSFLAKHREISIDNEDQSTQKRHTVDDKAPESQEENADVTIRRKSTTDGKEADGQENDDNSGGEDNDDQRFSSGNSEPTLFDGDQLESASLTSTTPGKEGRVARAKIYRPDKQWSFLRDEGNRDSEGSTKYVADDDKEEELHPEVEEQENAMGRDWVGKGPHPMTDWGDSEKPGANKNSGLKNDYEKRHGDKGKRRKMRDEKKHSKAAHKGLKHTKRTKNIFASSGKKELAHTKKISGLKDHHRNLRGGKRKRGKKYAAVVHRSLKHLKKTQDILSNLESELFSDEKKGKTSESERTKSHYHKGIHLKVHRKDRSGHKTYVDYSGSLPPETTSPLMSPAVAATPYMTPVTLPKPGFTHHYLRNALQKGAVCLDGSIPVFFFRKGFGDGLRNWIVYLQGGAWCDSKVSCLERAGTNLGSSRYTNEVSNPAGLLSADYRDNPAFFNWNVVYLPYCDGASFAGNRSDAVKVNGNTLYFRGKRILDAAMDDLLEGGLQHAREVVLSGTSAGGLAVMLHTDYIRDRLPDHVQLHSLADSGFFLDVPNRKGKTAFRKTMQNVFKLHDCTSGVNQACVSKMSAKDLWKCIFPQYFLKFVQTPLYMVNPIFDSWQLANIKNVNCAFHVEKCTEQEKREISQFGQTAMSALLRALHRSAAVQMFADACVDHGQVVSDLKWNKIKVQNLTISSAFTKWYRQRNKRALIRSVVDDTQILVNPTCV